MFNCVKAEISAFLLRINIYYTYMNSGDFVHFGIDTKLDLLASIDWTFYFPSFLKVPGI